MSSQVVSLRLPVDQVRRLKRLARRLGKTASETGALLIDEALRQSEFAYIEFRDSTVGRQAYIKGSSLAVWEVILVAQGYGLNAEKTAAHLEWPVVKVQAALNYAAGFPEDVRLAIEDNQEVDFNVLKRMLPGLRPFVVQTFISQRLHRIHAFGTPPSGCRTVWITYSPGEGFLKFSAPENCD